MNLRVTQANSQKNWSNGQPGNQQNTKQYKEQGMDFDNQDQLSLNTKLNHLVTYNAQGNLVVIQTP
ncbi:MAG: hypothetical protein RBR42_04095 [Desulfomicrobium sp.]|jgi:hypothetical protein|nr:hypothetical protein [Desulfomicrobium sp.]NLV96581.1 hypothetical protein [Desulfovibrionales bacterium]